MLGLAKVIYTLSVSRPQPHNTNLSKEKRERENSRRQKEIEQLRQIKKHWHCSIVNPPFHAMAGSARSFHRDPEKGIKVLRYSEVLQWGALECRCSTREPSVTLTDTYGTGIAPQRGCIGSHLILCSIHNTNTDRRWAMHTQTTPN